ncbi:MAG: DUF2474 family protein [Chromatocurvus sp.]
MKRPRLRWPAIEATRSGPSESPLWKRLLWMVGIWIASVAALLLVALVLRLVLQP